VAVQFIGPASINRFLFTIPDLGRGKPIIWFTIPDLERGKPIMWFTFHASPLHHPRPRYPHRKGDSGKLSSLTHHPESIAHFGGGCPCGKARSSCSRRTCRRPRTREWRSGCAFIGKCSHERAPLLRVMAGA
jgi:hypothetical protein